MKRNIINHLVILSLSLFSLFHFGGCKQEDTLTYDEKPALYFPLEDKEAKKKGIDSAHVSFFHFSGHSELLIPFRVAIIGTLESDLEYRVEVIDTMTTAITGEYELPERLIFRAGRQFDTLYVKVLKTDRLSTTDVKVAFRIVENENFRKGYFNMQTVKLRFDNIVSKPGWWDKTIEKVYFGKFSAAKYEVFKTVANQLDIEGFEPWELRQLCLDMKEYIKENNITEADGSEMIIVGY